MLSDWRPSHLSANSVGVWSAIATFAVPKVPHTKHKLALARPHLEIHQPKQSVFGR